MSMNEPDLGWWEKEEPEDLTEELETAGYRWTAEDEADMRVTDAQENWVEWDMPGKPVRNETGWLFSEEDLKEIA
jgi:hypothetical protein